MTKDESYNHIYELLTKMENLVNEMFTEDFHDNDETVCIDDSEDTCAPNTMTS